MNLRSLNKALGLISICIGLTACVSTPKSPTVQNYLSGNYSIAAEIYANNHALVLGNKEHRDYALHSIELGQYLFDAGQFDKALPYFQAAAESFKQFQTKEAFASAVYAAEGAKAYKGEAYDRALTQFNIGLTHMMKRQYEQAARHFRLSIQEDASTLSDVEKHKQDFSIAWYFLGVCYDLLGQKDNARIAYKKSEAPEHFKSIKANTIIVISSGQGPYKSPRYATWTLAPSPFDNAQAKNKQTGEVTTGHALLNISEQAYQDADAMGSARDITGSIADTRYWSNVPDYYFVVPMNISQQNGSPSVTINGIYDNSVSDYPKNLTLTDFDETKLNTYYLRLNP